MELILSSTTNRLLKEGRLLPLRLLSNVNTPIYINSSELETISYPYD